MDSDPHGSALRETSWIRKNVQKKCWNMKRIILKLIFSLIWLISSNQMLKMQWNKSYISKLTTLCIKFDFLSRNVLPPIDSDPVPYGSRYGSGSSPHCSQCGSTSLRLRNLENVFLENEVLFVSSHLLNIQLNFLKCNTKICTPGQGGEGLKKNLKNLD